MQEWKNIFRSALNELHMLQWVTVYVVLWMWSHKVGPTDVLPIFDADILVWESSQNGPSNSSMAGLEMICTMII